MGGDPGDTSPGIFDQRGMDTLPFPQIFEVRYTATEENCAVPSWAVIAGMQGNIGNASKKLFWGCNITNIFVHLLGTYSCYDQAK
jgi:hypothetical protein